MKRPAARAAGRFFVECVGNGLACDENRKKLITFVRKFKSMIQSPDINF
jgi:hypothetical protein